MWIPAKAGMTVGDAGATARDAGMTVGDAGATARDAGMTVRDAGMSLRCVAVFHHCATFTVVAPCRRGRSR